MLGTQAIRVFGIVAMKLCTLLYITAFLIAVVIFNSRYALCTGSGKKLERRIAALYKTLDFMAQRPHQMNVDAIFGLTMTEAHIRRTIDHENIKFFDSVLLSDLLDVLDLSQRARRRAMEQVSTNSDGSAILNRVLNRPEIWMQSIDWSLGSLGPRPPPSKNISRSSVAEYFFQGTPDEVESDRCIVQLAEDVEKRQVCQVSDHCADMLLKNDDPRGYPLTHRLLYVQTAIVLGCKEHAYTPFDKLIPSYCTRILQDAIDMEATNFPSVSRDMISEQVLLCGMNGYAEFANDHYTGLILSWQNPAGCFSIFGFGENILRSRTKRESDKMDFGCDNHATGLGAASLALLIRNLVEMDRV